MPKRQTNYTNETGSIAAIAGHPLHPILVMIPIGGMFFTLCADIAL